MITVEFNLAGIPEGIANLAAQHHSCELLSFENDGGSLWLAQFRCPTREAANALIATLYNNDADEVEVHIIEDTAA